VWTQRSTRLLPLCIRMTQLESVVVVEFVLVVECRSQVSNLSVSYTGNRSCPVFQYRLGVEGHARRCLKWRAGKTLPFRETSDILDEVEGIGVAKQPSSSTDSQLVQVDESYLETVTHHGRDFQRYAIENGAYFAPIDEVSRRFQKGRRTSGFVC